MKINVCPKCKKEFKCLDGNCWCEKIKIPKEKLQRLEKKHSSCLCRDCLLKV